MSRARPDRRPGLVGRATAALTTAALAAAGCGAAPEGPERPLRGLAQALRAGDARAAYGWMSTSYRERVPLSELERLLAEHPEEARATADALERPLSVREEAVVRLADGETISLERDAEGWRVVTEVADYYGRRTPRETVRSFVRAVARRRYDVVVSLLPAAERSRTTAAQLEAQWEGEGREEIARLLAALRRAVVEAPVQETGDRAVLPYGDRFRVVLVRENGLWCIEDPE
jgi:hypothetical protein